MCSLMLWEVRQMAIYNLHALQTNIHKRFAVCKPECQYRRALQRGWYTSCLLYTSRCV